MISHLGSEFLVISDVESARHGKSGGLDTKAGAGEVVLLLYETNLGVQNFLFCTLPT